MKDRFTTRKATKIKRQTQTCKVFEVKVDQSKLSQKSVKHLNSLFIEAKWFYNYCLSQKDINNSDTTLKSVPVKVKDVFEDRDFTVLKAQMKQSIKTRLFGSLSSLHQLKLKGHKVGRLKFKPYVNSVPLVQYHKTFDIDYNNSTIRIAGLKQQLKVVGLKQLPKDCEIANAHLIKRDNDYFIHITTFVDKVERVVPERSIGIDFGCKTQLTLSDGTKIEFQVPPSGRLRRLDRKIMKKVNGKIGKKRPSNNRRKLQAQRRKEYLHVTNKKKDIKHKIVNVITSHYKYVCFQDESIHAWSMSNHGKKIQHSGIGGILSDLKHKSVTPIEVDKFFPSTQLCPVCGDKHKLSLDERVYVCPKCGYKMDRDVKSAICIEKEGMKQITSSKAASKLVPTDCRDIKPEENLSSAVFTLLSKIDNVDVSKIDSLSQEAPPLAVG